MRLPFFCLPCLFCLALFFGWSASGRSETPPKSEKTPVAALAPHRALYAVKLVGTKGASQLVDLRGRMFYKWQRGCEGWATSHRFSLDYDYDDMGSVNVSSEFATFEALDGRSFDFSSRRSKDGEVYEELRGNAQLARDAATGAAATAPGRARYSLPDGLVLDLPAGTIFPTTHTLALLDAARAGRKFLSARVFDGSDDSALVDINAFIGPVEKSESASGFKPGFKPVATSTVDSALLAPPARRVRMAFFPVDSDSAASDYELSMLFHENGVIGDMVIEYADFTVSQKLIALEKLDAENCKN
jgi:hypothetical protein